MSGIKNPYNGFFKGDPPSVNFFSSIDDDLTEPIEGVNSDALAQENALNKLRDENIKKSRETMEDMLDHEGVLGKVKTFYIIFLAPDSNEFVSQGISGHVVSSPFEISHYPIEIQENKKAVQLQISNNQRARLEGRESQNSPANTPIGIKECPTIQNHHSPASINNLLSSSLMNKLLIQNELKNQENDEQPTTDIEMHTFRDAIDVNYQRMALTEDELSGVPLEDLKSAASNLIEALDIRKDYMELIGGSFPSTTKNFLTGNYPENLPKCRKKNTETLQQNNENPSNKKMQHKAAHTSFNPPEPPIDHWGIDNPIPQYEQKYTLKRHHGTIAVLNSTGEILPELCEYYIKKEKYLKDYARLITMVANGPL